MGVHGLTSYVTHKGDLYLEDFQLKNCFLIIDGYSLASCLYNSSTKTNSAFGGDYDKYAKIIQKFIDILKMCNVTPIVICDGGYEKRKVNTVKKRNLQRIFVFEKISPLSANVQCFPLMMRHVFRETLLKLNVTLLQSDFEADNEIAALAKKLDAPVLSNDSDFFIFDVQYIPLSSMSYDIFKKTGKGQYCIPCQIFQIDKLLYGLGGLPKTMLPLLATILGNDYIKASQFKNFYSQLKMDKSKKTRPGQKRVKGLVSWLRNESFDTALNKVLQCVNRNVRKKVRRNIKNVMKGYTNLNTSLDSYLPSEIISRFQIKSEISEIIDELDLLAFSDVDSDDNSDSEENNDIVDANEASDEEEECESIVETDGESDCSNNIDDDDNICDEIINTTFQNSKRNSFPSWLLDESRKGNICPSINTLLLLKIYFFVPQVEDYEYPFSGAIALPILQTIAGLLNLDKFSYWARSKGRYVKTQLEAIKHSSNLNFPKLNELNDLSNSDRKVLFLETLKVENMSVYDSFPHDWQLYIASMVYWVKENENPMIKPWHVHALVMTLITVYVITSKTGKFWQKNTYMTRYGAKLKALEKKVLLKEDTLDIKSILDALNEVSEDDCIIAMAILVQYFHIDERHNRHSRNFSRGTIHLYAQFQSTFELASSLNSLLLMPLKRSDLSMFYNGTFLYNFTANFKSRPNILAYVDNLFSTVPKIRILYKTVLDKVYSLIPSGPKQKMKVRKNKHKTIRVKKEIVKSTSDNSDNEEFIDSNNKYSVLLNEKE